MIPSAATLSSSWTACPREGESVTLEDGMRLVVEALDKNRIELVHIWLPERKKDR